MEPSRRRFGISYNLPAACYEISLYGSSAERDVSRDNKPLPMSSKLPLARGVGKSAVLMSSKASP